MYVKFLGNSVQLTKESFERMLVQVRSGDAANSVCETAEPHSGVRHDCRQLADFYQRGVANVVRHKRRARPEA